MIKAGVDDDWHWETELPRDPNWREQLIAEIDGRPIGFLQIIDPAPEESHYWGSIGPGFRAIDIWIGESEFLGKGHGTEMMRQALARCFADASVHSVLIDPLTTNTRAIRFYRKLGFVFLERRMFDTDECDVHVLERGNWRQSDAD